MLVETLERLTLAGDAQPHCTSPLKGSGNMKSTFVAALMTVGAYGSAYAGGLDEPIMEPVMAPVIVEEQSGTSGEFVLPLMVIAIIAAIVTAD